MEKLLKLLKKFEKEIEKNDWFPIYNWGFHKFDWLVAEDDQTSERYKLGESVCILISKHYWFIKWLIKKNKLKNEPIFICDDTLDKRFYMSWILWQEDRYVALLSIMPDPVAALIDLLK